MLDCESPVWETSEDERDVVSGGWERVTNGRVQIRAGGVERVIT